MCVCSGFALLGGEGENKQTLLCCDVASTGEFGISSWKILEIYRLVVTVKGPIFNPWPLSFVLGSSGAASQDELLKKKFKKMIKTPVVF